MDEKLKVMAIVCHPADSIDHAGGTLCLHAKQGDAVTVVVCTHGVDSHDLRRKAAIQSGATEIDDQRTAISRKEREVVDGLAILGVTDVRFLRLRDDLITASTEMIEAIAAQLADVQPHLLLLHNPTEELGFEHGETAIAALRALNLAQTPRFLKGPATHTFPVQIFFMTMYGHTNQLAYEGMRHGDVLINITPVVERKVQAMDCLHSQYYTGNLARKCIEAVNGRMGLHAGVPYAEAFQTMEPHVYSHLPTNEYLMQRATTPTSQEAVKMRILVNDVPVAHRES
jgi:LmbE family N-acetylglucosaminyl deacetylase